MHKARLERRGDLHTVLPKGNFSKIPVCTVEGCNKKHTAKGLCQMHYRRMEVHGDVNKIARKEVTGKSEYKNVDGYIWTYLPDHPNATKQGVIAQHRLVMAEHLGRPLEKHENVHHKNGNRTDNRLENLELWSTNQPAGQRPEDKVEYALEILKLYAPEYLGKVEN